MTPILVHQPATDRWFVLTAYAIVQRRHPITGRRGTAYQHRSKHDITDQMRAILKAELRKHHAA